ncbi:MAG: Fic family protein [Deltaproteobacteria bacterium]|nr:Fic family protein [Deltaproteobacteria bacterium]
MATGIIACSESSQRPPAPLIAFEPVSTTLQTELEKLERLREHYRQAMTAGTILPNVIEATRIAVTYNSNAIEGSTLSLRDTQLVVEGLTPPGGKPLREIYEARNHDRALRIIESWAKQRPPAAPLTQADLLEVHAQVLAEIDPPAAGRFRTERVLISGSSYVPPGVHRFSELIPGLILLANRPNVAAALQAAELHYNLAAVHPFRDGNGRTARLMMNYCLLRRDFPHAIIAFGQRSEYLSALDQANAGDWEPFAAFVIRSIGSSIEQILGSEI